MPQPISSIGSSYRDPSGFMFEKDGILYRQVNTVFKNDFDLFTRNGCYDALVKKQWLVPHTEINENLSGQPGWYTTLQPARIPFISYPYEWSFDMLKDAALLTLQLVNEVVPRGLILKDATPYNVQWQDGKPIFIDTLSFEKYDPAQPWIAYRQFCESFLSPLLLMHYTGEPLQPMQLGWANGIPLAVTKSLLPWRSKLSFHTYLHIHLHGKLSTENAGKKTKAVIFSQNKLLRLIDSLRSLVQSLKWSGQSTWKDYYEEAGRRKNYLEEKKNVVDRWISELPGIKTAVDLGANEGTFARLAAAKNIFTLAADFDHSAINDLYLQLKSTPTKNIQPVIIDLSSPSPAIGVDNNERFSFADRTNMDLALALALIHHLAIGKNIPLQTIASFFAKLSSYLIIEFVPKEDEKVQFMLSQKKDIYYPYTEDNFLKAFEKYYFIEKKQTIADSGRILYQMKKRHA